MAGLFSSLGANPYMRQPPLTKDDLLGPGNTAPQSPPTQAPSNMPSPQMVGMGGTVVQRPLPLATVQQPGMMAPRPPVSSGAAQGNPTGPLYNGPKVVTAPPVSSAQAQGNFSGPRQDLLMPGGWQRNPATKTGGIMTDTHPDFIGRKSMDQSGGVRPGALPPMNAVQAARIAAKSGK